MSACPRCQTILESGSSLKMQRLWRLDQDAVVTHCDIKVTWVEFEVCAVCSFKELVDFCQKKGTKKFHPPVCLN